MTDTDTRPRYRCDCPNCGFVMFACKSIFQEMGMFDRGRGICPKCKTPFLLIFDPYNDSMKAKRIKDQEANAGL